MYIILYHARVHNGFLGEYVKRVRARMRIVDGRTNIQYIHRWFVGLTSIDCRRLYHPLRRYRRWNVVDVVVVADSFQRRCFSGHNIIIIFAVVRLLCRVCYDTRLRYKSVTTVVAVAAGGRERTAVVNATTKTLERFTREKRIR